MTDLPQYKADRACPKCGNNEIATVYRADDEKVPFGERFVAPQEQHLKRWCTRCAYVWYERPLDQ